MQFLPTPGGLVPGFLDLPVSQISWIRALRVKHRVNGWRVVDVIQTPGGLVLGFLDLPVSQISWIRALRVKHRVNGWRVVGVIQTPGGLVLGFLDLPEGRIFWMGVPWVKHPVNGWRVVAPFLLYFLLCPILAIIIVWQFPKKNQPIGSPVISRTGCGPLSGEIFSSGRGIR